MSDATVGSEPAAVTSWRELAHAAGRLFRLSYGISFRGKLPFMTGGLLLYYGALYALAVYQPNQGLDVADALYVLVEIPGAVLAVYLTMDLVARERDRQTLETLFSTASSHYLIWMVRMISVWAVLLVSLLAMSAIGYFFFAEFPFIRGGLNAFVPTFFLANVTFWFSVRVRGANTAAMLSAGFLFLVLANLETLGETSYWLFLNPFGMPVGGETLWVERVLLNRLGVLGAGSLLLFLALRRMERREKFLS